MITHKIPRFRSEPDIKQLPCSCVLMMVAAETTGRQLYGGSLFYGCINPRLTPLGERNEVGSKVLFHFLQVARNGSRYVMALADLCLC